MKKLGISLIFLILIFYFQSNAQNNAMYQIKNLHPSDPVYIKFKEDIKQNAIHWKNLKKNFEMTELQKFKKLSIALYTFKKEDTLFSVAEKMGMVVDTLISFNSIANNLSVKEGDEILIPNMDGVVLFPKKQLKLIELEKLYKIPIEVLMYINNIHRDFLYPQEEIFIPFARMTEEEKSYFFAKQFIFPIRGGKFSSSYGLRIDPFTHRWTFHGGMDIATPIGTKIYAAAEGNVIFSGWEKDYGKLVVIQHKYGYTTWYGHLSVIYVQKGQWVKQGDLLALSGSTGRSTGPHLHFEIRRFNLRKNPMEVLDFNHSSHHVINE